MKAGFVAIALLLASPAAGQVDPAPRPDHTAEADALLKKGRLQEAAWAARAAGDTARGDAILARLDSLLRATPRSFSPLAIDSQGVSFTFRLEQDAGVAALFKVDGSDIFCPTCGAAREVAVYRIDRLLWLDLTPMTVFQRIVEDGDTLRGSAMYWIEGARRPQEEGRSKPDRLRFLDAVIGNSDRHAANWLVRGDGSVVAIDHNRAFEYRPSSRPKTCWEVEVDSLRAPGALGAPFDRYRDLPGDSLAAAVDGILDPELAERFVTMRDRVVERIERRALRPEATLPRNDCPWEG